MLRTSISYGILKPKAGCQIPCPELANSNWIEHGKVKHRRVFACLDIIANQLCFETGCFLPLECVEGRIFQTADNVPSLIK